MSDDGGGDDFFRDGDPIERLRLLTIIAEEFGVPPQDVKRKLEELLDDARAGRMSDSKVQDLDRATDLINKVDAFDRPWTFGYRYFMHKFTSIDPQCMNCRNTVPHRTMIICPTCGATGPWNMTERTVAPSYVHYLMVEQATRLVGSSLVLPDGLHYADGLIMAVPRGGAKSTWLCEILGTQLVMTRRSRCLLIMSNTTDQTADRCAAIRTELEENQKLIADYGVQQATRQDQRSWTRADFVLPNKGRVVGRGAMQSMRGVKNNEYRPDVAITDDADDEKFMTTPEQADKMYQWWDSRVIPAMHPNSVYIDGGTVIGELGLLWQKLRGQRGASSAKYVIKALQDRPGCNQCGLPANMVGPMDCPICRTRTEAIRPCSFWGARFTTQALAAVRRRVGMWSWNTEYQQEPHDSSTSWFSKDALDRSTRTDLAPLVPSARRILPWSAISVSVSCDEAVKIAALGDRKLNRVPGDHGPYQAIVQAWDPAWARETGPKQKTAYMAGVGMGLTWDDRFDLFWLDRDRALAGTSAYRKWMYRTWINDIVPVNHIDNKAQLGMIIERNAAGVLFQYGIEEHWGSVPVVDHQTGAEKHDLEDGIPGLASAVEEDRLIIRGGGTPKQIELSEELKYELQRSGNSLFKDMLMATWMAWSYLSRFMRDIRDPARYRELERRSQPRWDAQYR